MRRRQVLERHHPPARKRNRFVGESNRRRNVGIIKRVVERIAKEGKVTSMVEKAVMESESAVEPRTVTIIRVIGGAVRGVAIFYINPGFGRMPSHFAHGF